MNLMNDSMPFPNIVSLQSVPEFAKFGAIRKHDIHTGIDFHCEEGQIVNSLTQGIVIQVAPFTGAEANCPWWEDTSYVGIYSNEYGYIVYGEITSSVVIGQKVNVGDVIGKVKRVLKKDKGKPTSMFHLELYKSYIDEPVVWNLNEPKPELLLDPKVLFDE